MSGLLEYDKADEIYKVFKADYEADSIEDAEDINVTTADRQFRMKVMGLNSHLKRALYMLARRKSVSFRALINRWLENKAEEDMRSIGRGNMGKYGDRHF